MSLLRAEGISVADGDERLLSPLSIDLVPGEPLIILGETGSGKSLMAQALMGTLPAGLQASGQVAVGGHVLKASDPAGFRGLWGREIGVLPQEPWLSLDPLMRAREQIAETHVLVRGLNRRDATERAGSDLATFDLADAGRRYPHELSGGMAQRVAIAAARAGGAKIIIADEPTKGLDTARRDSVANLLLSEIGVSGGLLVITHDLPLARRIGGQVIVLRSGEIVESGATEKVFAAPSQAYTRELIAADPENWTPRDKGNAGGDPVVTGSGLSLARGGKTLFRDLSVSVRSGSVFGVTGPSGCGKSSLGDVLLGLVKPTQGSVRRRAGDAPTAFQKLYQDPVSAFPRRCTLRQSIEDVARLSGRATDTIDAQMNRLGLAPRLLDRRSDAVSGGELQRLSLLRVLLMRPSFIFADEPTSRLDPITQAKVISLLTGVADQDDVAVMLVSHDRALIRNTADDALQMGEVNEKFLPLPEACAASVLQ